MMSELNPDNIDFFNGKEWCNNCRAYYSCDMAVCPDCMPENELQTGTFKELSKDVDKTANFKAETHFLAVGEIIADLDAENEKLKTEVKKAFWAGFEISHSLGGTDIQARWNEYEKLRGLGE